MKTTLAFAAGFAAGWVARGAFDTSKPATVQVVAFVLDSVARVRRASAIELERLEDLIAEARDLVARRRAARDVGADGAGQAA
jgi:hypothetical protein